jgi:DNA polymerase-4
VAKSISREETFGIDLSSDDDLERELLRLVVRAASDLRADGLAARTITGKLRDADFKTRQASRTLPSAVIADRVILATARSLLTRLRRVRRVSARLLGVSLSSLDTADLETQLSLFDGPSESLESDRDRALAEAVDKLRAKFGKSAIVPGRLTRQL